MNTTGNTGPFPGLCEVRLLANLGTGVPPQNKVTNTLIVTKSNVNLKSGQTWFTSPLTGNTAVRTQHVNMTDIY